MRRSRRVAALPGEGIGPEVTAAALEVLRRAGELGGLEVSVAHAPFGSEALRELGDAFPEVTRETCRASDGILLGAVEKEGLLALRRHFDFFANLRPVRAVDCLLAGANLPAEKVRGLDLLFVRELTSGLPFGAAGRGEDERGPYGFHTMLYRDHEIRRVARVALQHAAARRGLLTVAHKQNALPLIPWCELTADEARAFPGVRVETVLVDTLAMRLLEAPRSFDVLLAENLTGDWLSSLGGALVGSIGALPSASLNADGFGLYEPIHGTAPDIAGKGVANPLGAIGSAVLMLRQWGEVEAADRIDGAVDRVLRAGVRTADLPAATPGRRVTTRGMVDAVLVELEAAAPAAVAR